jgi:hypothetical protein
MNLTTANSFVRGCTASRNGVHLVIRDSDFRGHNAVCLDSIPALDFEVGSAPECLLHEDYVFTSNGTSRVEVRPSIGRFGL